MRERERENESKTITKIVVKCSMIRKAHKKALNRIKFHSWKNFMCLILFTYDGDLLGIWCPSVHLQMLSIWIYGTDLASDEIDWASKLARKLNGQLRNTEVTIVMLCNGLMTSSKDLQQLSCYSNCCSKGNGQQISGLFFCSALASVHCTNDHLFSFRSLILRSHKYRLCSDGQSRLLNLHDKYIIGYNALKWMSCCMLCAQYAIYRSLHRQLSFCQHCNRSTTCT